MAVQEKTTINSGYKYENIVPNDSASLDGITRGILLESDGAIKVLCPATQEEVTIANLAGGIIHPIQTNKIFDTGTDATSVFVLY